MIDRESEQLWSFDSFYHVTTGITCALAYVYFDKRRLTLISKMSEISFIEVRKSMGIQEVDGKNSFFHWRK